MDVNELSSIPLFDGLSDKELGGIAPLFDVVDVEPGKELALKDRLGHEFFILLEGECQVQYGDRAPRALNAGEFFGEISLLESERRTVTVVASTPVKLAVTTGANLRTIAIRNDAIDRRLRSAIEEHRARDAAASS